MTLRTPAQVIDFDGELAAPYSPTVSDTFSINDLPGILEINNASGGSINYTLVDGGRTGAGTAAAALTPVAIAAGAKRRFKLTKDYADSTGVVTVTLSAVTTVTAEFYKL
jgi:hypothetical protein